MRMLVAKAPRNNIIGSPFIDFVIAILSCALRVSVLYPLSEFAAKAAPTGYVLFIMHLFRAKPLLPGLKLRVYHFSLCTFHFAVALITSSSDTSLLVISNTSSK